MNASAISSFDQAEFDQLADAEVSFLEGIAEHMRRGEPTPERVAYYRKHVAKVKAALALAEEALP